MNRELWEIRIPHW